MVSVDGRMFLSGRWHKYLDLQGEYIFDGDEGIDDGGMLFMLYSLTKHWPVMCLPRDMAQQYSPAVLIFLPAKLATVPGALASYCREWIYSRYIGSRYIATPNLPTLWWVLYILSSSDMVTGPHLQVTELMMLNCSSFYELPQYI